MTGETYTNTFGGENVNPANLSYIAYTTAVSLTLVWPFEAVEGDNVAADKIDVTTSVASLTITMPPADKASVGQDALIRNTGSYTFTVADSDGNTIGTVASGEAWYFVITDNSDAAGTWYAIEFGVGTSSASAASLAGAGLQASSTLLRLNLPVTQVNADYSGGANDRATVIESTGGTIALDLPNPTTIPNGWFIGVINAGSGNFTITPAAGTIDGAATKVLAPTENCLVWSTGTVYLSLGYGRAITNTVTGASIDIAGTGTYALNANEQVAQVQDWVGVLTGARIVEYGTNAGYWFVWNNTSGAYTVTARVNSLDTGVVVTQSTFSILRSNGSNMEVAFTATNGTVTSVGTTAGELTGGPITTTGTLGLANTAVTPGAYGSASQTLTATVDAKGRLTALAATAISILVSQIQTFTSAALRALCSDPTGTGSLVFATSPTLVTASLGNSTATTQAAGNSSTRVATTAFVGTAVAAVAAVPTASVFPYSGSSAPTGYLLCNGSAVSRTTYADLFAIIATTYGAGNGTTTFNIPDIRGRVVAGVDSGAGRLGSGSTGGITGAATLAATGGEQSHTLTDAEMPSHTHTFTNIAGGGNAAASGGGAVSNSATGNTGSAGSDDPHNNVQPTIVLNYIIKT